MKKCISMILAAAMVLSLAACGGQQPSGGNTSGGAGTSGSGASSDTKVSFNVSVPDADNSYIYAAAQEFKARVEEYSGGSIELTVYPNGSLYGGDGNAAISSVGNGSLDIVILAASLYASFDPSFFVISVPYLFDDIKQLQDYLNSDTGLELFNSVESMGITCLGRWTRSFRQVTNSKTPINSPDDLKGMVLRTPSNSLYVEFFTACGANATPMNFSEVYNALQLNTLDGQENPVDVPATNNFYEVQKYISGTNHIADAWVVGMNTAKLTGLSQNQQDALRKAAEECQQWYVDYQAEKDGEMLKLLTDNGMEYNEVPQDGFEQFVAISQGLYPKFKELVANDALFDATTAFCGKS
ncbi:MAG: DctP family TRAP transporter solute-binding subunit [Lawsonibacter sp.]|nr:DctP family TRAP transporter solute-binding subunit [Lawsonibacter sp.]MCI8914872.1 DctP family TRAP transporter solute-binding subunit [Lawsonibacter sp.]